MMDWGTLGPGYDDKFHSMEVGKLQATVTELEAEIERLQAEMDTDHVQHMLNIKRKDAEIERLQKRVEGLERDRWKPEAQRTNERLRLLQEDTALRCLHQEDEIKHLRALLENLEAWVEQTNPDAYEKWKATQR